MSASSSSQQISRRLAASQGIAWRPRSVQSAFRKAMARTQCKTQALRELDHLQARLIAKDVRKVWGQNHPNAVGEVGK